MVWFAVTLLKLYEVTAPCETPSTSTLAIVWQESGVMVKPLLAPQLTPTTPLGLIAPPAPAEALMVKLPEEVNVALMVWLASTLVKVYVPTAPCETPSTSTSVMLAHGPGVMVKAW